VIFGEIVCISYQNALVQQLSTSFAESKQK